jgi:peptide/nickel transport system substrate-binding protein
MTQDQWKTNLVRTQGGLWLSPSLSRRRLLLGAGAVTATAALAACSGNPKTDSSNKSGPVGAPKQGGNFRLGVTGGGAKDIFDGQNVNNTPDGARLLTAFETLLTFDDDFKLTNDGLAESVEADSPTQYTIKLRQGIEFHDGKTLTADDVIYSLQRVANDVSLRGNSAAGVMDIAGMKKLDDYTVRLPLLTPDSTLPEKLAAYYFSIVPEGYETYSGDPSTQVGTGPYRLESFTPGRESIHARHENYWRDGQPYFDSVNITNFSDATAQVNALLGGQIDAMTDLPAAQVAVAEGRGQEVLVSETGWWIGMAMAIDMAPFDDVRVRQAFRLLADRQSMLEQAVSGYGEVGNDMYGRYDAGYASELPQRERDVDEARSLLEAAGHDDLTVDLFTTNATGGMVEMATVFAEQAKDVGVTVNVKNLPSDIFYGDDYGKYAFSMDYWAARPYLQQVEQGSLESSPYNMTHWPPTSGEASDFGKLYDEALATTDPAQRAEIERKMQQMEYDLGGWIIPFFPSNIDGHAANVQGFAPAKTTFGLADFGRGFRTIWFD